MDNTTTTPPLLAYTAALACLPAMGKGFTGPHWEAWVSFMKQLENASPEDLAAMRPLTETEEGCLWDAYHHTGALSHTYPRAEGFAFDSLFEASLPWLFAHEKMSWSRAATRWMAEPRPAGEPSSIVYQEVPLKTMWKDDRVRGFNVRLGVDIACAASGTGPDTTESAAQRRHLREHILATLAYAPMSSGWRHVITARAIWRWPELVSSPAYASARTRPPNEPLALGAGLSRNDLFFSLLNNPECAPGAPGNTMVLMDLSPPSTLNFDEWHQWIHTAAGSCLADDEDEKSLPPALWDIITDRLLIEDPVALLDAARILRLVLISLTPPPAACHEISAWWDVHRAALRPQRAFAQLNQDPVLLGEMLLDCPFLLGTLDWSSRYASAEMTPSQVENVLNSLTPHIWSEIEPAILEWALKEVSDPLLAAVLLLLEGHVDCHITQTAQWMEVYLANCSAGHSAFWLPAWLGNGRLPLTPLPRQLLTRLLQAPDREVREYAIRTMAHGRAPQSPPALDSSPSRPPLP